MIKKHIIIWLIIISGLFYIMFKNYAEGFFLYNKMTDDSYIKKIALHGTPEELDFLVKKIGVDVNADYGCATLLTASINGLIINKGVPPENTIKKINLLIEAGADVNLTTCRISPLTTVVLLPRKMNEFKMLLADEIDYQLDDSDNICNIDGISKKCKETSPEERNRMKEKVISDIEKEEKILETYYARIIDILLQNGADINKKTGGITPLHITAMAYPNESLFLLKKLLEKGANPNIRDYKGSTPLFVANFSNNTDTIKLLKLYGADETLRNNKGLTYTESEKGN